MVQYLKSLDVRFLQYYLPTYKVLNPCLTYCSAPHECTSHPETAGPQPATFEPLGGFEPFGRTYGVPAAPIHKHSPTGVSHMSYSVCVMAIAYRGCLSKGRSCPQAGTITSPILHRIQMYN